MPYLWAYKGRVLFALGCLVAAKLATVSVPILLKDIVDSLIPAMPSTQAAAGLLVVPLALINLGTAAFWALTREWIGVLAVARWPIAAALIVVPFVLMGRKLSAGLAPRTYRYAT